MSFTRLFAVSRNIIGIRGEKSPFRVKQENLIPKLNPVEKPLEMCCAAQPSAEVPGAEMELPAARFNRASAVAAVVPEVREKTPTRTSGRKPKAGASGVLHRVKAGLARLAGRSSSRGGPGAGARAVQTELLLDAVKVVRNDLKDCDLEAQAVRQRAGKARGAMGTRQPLGMVWNRLSARLLRQAVQDFNVVQKERGKLLTQAGDGRGSARDV